MLGFERIKQIGENIFKIPNPSPALNAYIANTALGNNPNIPVDKGDHVSEECYGRYTARIIIQKNDFSGGERGVEKSYIINLQSGKTTLTYEGKFPSSSRR